MTPPASRPSASPRLARPRTFTISRRRDLFSFVAARLVFAFSVGAALFGSAGGTTLAAPAGDLQAHGSDERLWVARGEAVTSGGTTTDQTSLFVRERGTADWHRMEPISTRVVGLANRGSQLAILL